MRAPTHLSIDRFTFVDRRFDREAWRPFIYLFAFQVLSLVASVITCLGHIYALVHHVRSRCIEFEGHPEQSAAHRELLAHWQLPHAVPGTLTRSEFSPGFLSFLQA